MTDYTDPSMDAPAPPAPAPEAAGAETGASPGPRPLAGPLDTRKVFDSLLRNPAQLVERLAQPGHGALVPLLGLLLVSMVIYGVVLGSFAMGEQLWAAPLKITTGLLISAVICFPSLYIFSCLAGSRVGVGQLAICMAAMLALAGLLLLGFAPAVWVFTQGTDSFLLMGLLALGPWLVAVWFGCRFLFHVAKSTGAHTMGPVKLWAAIFLVVTLQMTVTLRPVLGRSERFLSPEKRFFLEHWFLVGDRTLTSPAPVWR